MDSRFKFVVLTFVKNTVDDGDDGVRAKNLSPLQKNQSFPAAFMRHEISELTDFPNSDSLQISTDLIKKLSPDSQSIMEFKNETDIKIAEKMLAFPLLGEQLENTWNLKLAREFDVTQKDVSSLVHVNYKENLLPIYEGKMIWQFNHQFSEPKFWVEKDSFKKYMNGNKTDNSTVFDYENFRLVYRRLASSTNEHTLVSAIIPPSPHADNLASVKLFDEHGKKLRTCLVKI